MKGGGNEGGGDEKSASELNSVRLNPIVRLITSVHRLYRRPFLDGADSSQLKAGSIRLPGCYTPYI